MNHNQLSQEDHKSRMWHISAWMSPEEHFRERLCLGFSVQKTVNGRPWSEEAEGAQYGSVLFCPRGPRQRAPKHLQYLVLLWQEGLPRQPLSKGSYWIWLPMLDFGAEAGVIWNMFNESHSTTTCALWAQFFWKLDQVHSSLT